MEAEKFVMESLRGRLRLPELAVGELQLQLLRLTSSYKDPARSLMQQY